MSQISGLQTGPQIRKLDKKTENYLKNRKKRKNKNIYKTIKDHNITLDGPRLSAVNDSASPLKGV